MSTPITDVPLFARVKWTHYARGSYTSTRHRGKVARKTAATVWVVPDTLLGTGRDVSFRASRSIGTVDIDILSAHELALEAWARCHPSTGIVRLRAGLGEELYEVHARLTVDTYTFERVKLEPLEYLHRLRFEADELYAWLARRPEP